mgnify:FL=1
MSAIERITDHERVRQILDKAKDSSEQQLEKLRSAARKIVGDATDVIIGVNGSIARREFTSGSDVDFFILTVDASVDAANDVLRR